MSDTSPSRDARIDAILAAYLEAVDAGKTPDRDELLRQHPEFAAELAAFFANHDRAADLAAPPRPEEMPTLAPCLAPPVPGVTVRYFGDYELLEEVARGGMGVVYKTRQVSLNRIVAVKMILAGQLASEEDVRRLRTEAENTANLDHPNFVLIYGSPRYTRCSRR